MSYVVGWLVAQAQECLQIYQATVAPNVRRPANVLSVSRCATRSHSVPDGRCCQLFVALSARLAPLIPLVVRVDLTSRLDCVWYQNCVPKIVLHFDRANLPFSCCSWHDQAARSPGKLVRDAVGNSVISVNIPASVSEALSLYFLITYFTSSSLFMMQCSAQFHRKGAMRLSK